MVIDVSSQCRVVRGLACAVIITTLTAPALRADDQITKTDGSTLSGSVVGVIGDGANKQVMIQSRSASGSVVKLPYHLSDIKSVTMATPAAAMNLGSATPDQVVAALEPLVKTYAGVPADWVVDAMAQLAEAYSALGKSDLAASTYNDIDTFYPGSKYHLQAVAGKASLSLKQGKVDEALAAVQPIIDEANKNLSPSATEGGLYAAAFIVYGQALEQQKKNAAALEAYLTVKTMFYQNVNLATQADDLAKKLREANPGLGVD